MVSGLLSFLPLVVLTKSLKPPIIACKSLTLPHVTLKLKNSTSDSYRKHYSTLNVLIITVRLYHYIKVLLCIITIIN